MNWIRRYGKNLTRFNKGTYGHADKPAPCTLSTTYKELQSWYTIAYGAWGGVVVKVLHY